MTPDLMRQRLDIYGEGKVIQSFGTGLQAFWDWHFWHGSTQVAFTIGPLHGGAAVARLCDIATGKTVSSWTPDDGVPPDWAQGLRY